LDRQKVHSLLTSLSKGERTVTEIYEELKTLPFKNLDFARIDSHRSLRQGAPEVIFCPGKTAEQIIAIAQELKSQHAVVLGTKASAEVARSIKKALPETQYFEASGLLIWGQIPSADPNSQQVAVVTAGTGDTPVAEEASLCLQAAGVRVERINDVGVAGLHRLLDVMGILQESVVCIVIAGMDGVLPSVVAGLVAIPVVAVPTSVGYGASFEGLAALLTMLNSCAAGLTVVNIDNGFGAAMAALRIMALRNIKSGT
jgi:NCAIR mutase (PurE)-related protein